MKSSFNVGFERPGVNKGIASGAIIAGDVYKIYSDTTGITSPATEWTSAYKFTMQKPGSIRISHALRNTGGGTAGTYHSYSRVVLNGNLIGNINDKGNGTGPTQYTNDIVVKKGDFIAIEFYSTYSGAQTSISNVSASLLNDIAVANIIKYI